MGVCRRVFMNKATDGLLTVYDVRLNPLRATFRRSRVILRQIILPGQDKALSAPSGIPI